MWRGDEYLRRGAVAFAAMARVFLRFVPQHEEAPLRERFGAERFEVMKSLARMYEELGEGRFQEVLAAKIKAEVRGEPVRN
jgi:hypothetical protein